MKGVGKVIKLAIWEFRPIVRLAQWVRGQENVRASNRREGCGVWGPASEGTGASMCTGKARERGLAHLESPGALAAD